MLPRGISNTRFDTATCEPNCLVTPSRRTAEPTTEEWFEDEYVNDSSDPLLGHLATAEHRAAREHCNFQSLYETHASYIQSYYRAVRSNPTFLGMPHLTFMCFYADFQSCFG